MTVSIERRVQNERRRSDAGPPTGCCDRRQYAERRLPEVAETVISDSEWEKLFGGVASAASTESAVQEHAAEVFSRVRNHF